jgi:hypothetical protein
MSREIKSRCRLSQAPLTKLVFLTPGPTTTSLRRHDCHTDDRFRLI